MRKFINIFCVVLFFIYALIFPLHVVGDEFSCMVPTTSGTALVFTGWQDDFMGLLYNDNMTSWGNINNISAGIFKYSSSSANFIIASKHSSEDIWNNSTPPVMSYRYNGTWYSRSGNYSGVVNHNGENIYFWYIPVIDNLSYIECSVDISSNPSSFFNAYYDFFFGDMPREWGSLVDVGFNTSIAGSGQAAINNIDKIKWNNSADSYGNVFDDSCKVQIRAVPGQYSGSSRENLIEKKYTDFILDNTNLAVLGEYPALIGEASFNWQTVINRLNIPFVSISSLLQKNDSWLKKGWIYQYRLVADGFSGDWKTIYTLTSSGVKNDIKVINITNIDNDVIQFVTDITDIDVDIDIVIIYEDIIIPPLQPTPTPDPSATPSPVDPDPDGLPWWAYLLNAILDLIRSITEGIASIISSIIGAVSDIINGVLGLFSFTTFEIPDFNIQMQNIKDNSGMVGESLTFTQNLKNTFEGVQYAEPVLHWQGISIDGITVIPAADYNLNTYVEQLGLTNFRQIAYTVTDGMIYFSLVILIIKKIEGIFRK